MSKCSATKSNETTTGENRKCWRLQDILPSINDTLHFIPYFKLQNEEWSCDVFLSCTSLRIILTCISSDIGDKFNVLAGISGESGQEITISKALPISNHIYIIHELICYSKLQFIVHSNELFVFFLEIERKIKDEEKTLKTKVLKRKYQADFKAMLLSGDKHDLTINVNHKKYYCHTNILSARSPVFSAMLEHKMKEKCTGEVFITDSQPDTFQEFLLYLYTGSDEHLNWENVIDLYKLGDKYCVEDLKHICVEHMKTKITTKNFFEIFLLSQLHSDSELSEATTEFFLCNSKDIIGSEKWNEILKSNPDEAHLLIKAL